MDLLKSYLERTDESGKRLVTQAVFAERVGTSAATVSKLVNGSLKPSLELAYRIDRETDGVVPMSSWVSPAPDAEEATAGPAAASFDKRGANIERVAA